MMMMMMGTRSCTTTTTTTSVTTRRRIPRRRRRPCVTTRAGKDNDNDGGVLGKLGKLNPFKRRDDAGGALERKKPSEEKKEFLSREVSEQIFGKGLMGKIAASAVNAAASEASSLTT